jgi:hypothetical protein
MTRRSNMLQTCRCSKGQPRDHGRHAPGGPPGGSPGHVVRTSLRSGGKTVRRRFDTVTSADVSP